MDKMWNFMHDVDLGNIRGITLAAVREVGECDVELAEGEVLPDHNRWSVYVVDKAGFSEVIADFTKAYTASHFATSLRLQISDYRDELGLGTVWVVDGPVIRLSWSLDELGSEREPG